MKLADSSGYKQHHAKQYSTMQDDSRLFSVQMTKCWNLICTAHLHQCSLLNRSSQLPCTYVYIHDIVEEGETSGMDKRWKPYDHDHSTKPSVITLQHR